MITAQFLFGSATWTIVLVGLFLVSSATITWAVNVPATQERSAFRLLAFCTSADANQINWCEGYLMGLADLLLAMGNSGIPGGICKAEYEPTVLRKQFQFWSKRHPERSADD